MRAVRITSNSPERTLAIGETLGRRLKGGDCVCLEGELGAGKTLLSKGICRALGIAEAEVSSPTFAIVNEYAGDCDVLHFDFYRVTSVAEIVNIGWDDYVARSALILIEWPEKGAELLPERRIVVSLEQPENGDAHVRRISIQPPQGDKRFDDLSGD